LFSKNNNNIVLVQEHYFKMMDLISLVTIPVMTLMLINAELLIQFIYGEKWLDAVVIFQILAFFVITKSLTSPTNGLFNAMGQPKKSVLFLRFFVPLFLVVIILGALFDSLLVFTLILVTVRIFGSLILMKEALKLIDIHDFKKFNDVTMLLIFSIIFSVISFFLSEHLILKLLLSFLFLLCVFLYFKLFSKTKYHSILKDVKKLL
jgi:teichuronic acid exporter